MVLTPARAAARSAARGAGRAARRGVRWGTDATDAATRDLADADADRARRVRHRSSGRLRAGPRGPGRPAPRDRGGRRHLRAIASERSPLHRRPRSAELTGSGRGERHVARRDRHRRAAGHPVPAVGPRLRAGHARQPYALRGVDFGRRARDAGDARDPRCDGADVDVSPPRSSGSASGPSAPVRTIFRQALPAVHAGVVPRGVHSSYCSREEPRRRPVDSHAGQRRCAAISRFRATSHHAGTDAALDGIELIHARHEAAAVHGDASSNPAILGWRS